MMNDPYKYDFAHELCTVLDDAEKDDKVVWYDGYCLTIAGGNAILNSPAMQQIREAIRNMIYTLYVTNKLEGETHEHDKRLHLEAFGLSDYIIDWILEDE